MSLPPAILPWYGWPFLLGLAGLLAWAIMISKRGGDAGAAGGQADRRFPRREGVKTSESDFRDLSIGAYLSGMWNFPINVLETNASPAEMQRILAEAWDVTTHEAAMDTLRWLLDSGHRDRFDDVAVVAGPDPSRAANERLEETFGPGAADDLKEPRDNLVATYDELCRRGIIETDEDLRRGTAAWDYSRAVTVARFAHTAGFVNGDEAWEIVRGAGRLARDQFSSWEEFHKSYVLGRAMWNGVSQLEDPGLVQLYQDVRSAKDSPFQLVSWS